MAKITGRCFWTSCIDVLYTVFARPAPRPFDQFVLNYISDGITRKVLDLFAESSSNPQSRLSQPKKVALVNALSALL